MNKRVQNTNNIELQKQNWQRKQKEIGSIIIATAIGLLIATGFSGLIWKDYLQNNVVIIMIPLILIGSILMSGILVYYGEVDIVENNID